MDVPGFPFEPALILERRRALQKPRAREEFFAWYLCRRVSIYLTLVLARTPVTPNQITVVGTAVGVAGGALWAVGAGWSFLAGALCLELMYVLDCVDGELARLTGRQSALGAYLDLLGHYLFAYCMIMGLGIGLARTFGTGVVYVAIGIVIAYLGDELLRDTLLKARVKSGRLEGLDRLDGTFSLSNAYAAPVRLLGALVGSPGLFTGMIVVSLVDLALGVHHGKFALFLLWGAANTVKFAVRFRRILRAELAASATAS